MRMVETGNLQLFRPFEHTPERFTDMAQKTNRAWSTIYDRQNHRTQLLAGSTVDDFHWAPIKHDPTVSLPSVYDIRRIENEEDIVFVEVHLADRDVPRRFPRDLLNYDQKISNNLVWFGQYISHMVASARITPAITFPLWTGLLIKSPCFMQWCNSGVIQINLHYKPRHVG